MEKGRHGQWETTTYKSWTSMKQRCNNENAPDYHRYGGRGIKVCDEWLDFVNFYNDMGDRPKDFTLDRVDNDGDYTPDNCKWSSSKEQTRNRRDTNLQKIDGVTMCFKDWCERYGIPRTTVYNRMRRSGMTFEQALTSNGRKR